MGLDSDTDSNLGVDCSKEPVSKSKPIITQEHTSTLEKMMILFVLVEYLDGVIPRSLLGIWSRKGGTMTRTLISKNRN